VVTDDADRAQREASGGTKVVLVVAPGAAAPAARPGLALVVGDPRDPAVGAAAAEMDRELYRLG
jgi:hypothetical protein